MALPLTVYIVVSALSLEDGHGQTLIPSDYSILLDLVNQYHSTPIIHMPLQLSIRHKPFQASSFVLNNTSCSPLSSFARRRQKRNKIPTGIILTLSTFLDSVFKVKI
jgi:hypothetical protein